MGRLECKQLCQNVVDCYSQQMCYGEDDGDKQVGNAKSLDISQLALRSVQELHIRLLTLECDLEKLLAIELDKSLVDLVFYKHKLGTASFKQIKHDIVEGF